jgi:hypothetical protein
MEVFFRCYRKHGGSSESIAEHGGSSDGTAKRHGGSSQGQNTLGGLLKVLQNTCGVFGGYCRSHGGSSDGVVLKVLVQNT